MELSAISIQLPGIQLDGALSRGRSWLASSSLRNPRRGWAGITRFLFFVSLNTLENLLAVHGDILGGFDTDPNLVTFNAEHGDIDIITDFQCFTDTPSKYEHADRPC
jgi:hypothetical protein